MAATTVTGTAISTQIWGERNQLEEVFNQTLRNWDSRAKNKKNLEPEINFGVIHFTGTGETFAYEVFNQFPVA